MAGLLPLCILLNRANGQSNDLAVVACGHCHTAQAAQFQNSAHARTDVECVTCHGGKREYQLPADVIDRYRRLVSTQPSSEPGAATARFDHGESFRGKVPRLKVPETCGGCHADVARMNPYGLPTDQLAQYRVSMHGKAVFEKGLLQAAVCIDCHGVHDILSPKNPLSHVYPRNIPGTCGRCHGDPKVMAASNVPTNMVQEYRESVHGRGLLEGGDVGMPQCATCHGSHAAVPPGFRVVGHVCGKCHQQEEEKFLESIHGKLPNYPRCVACHVASLNRHDHRIQRVIATPAAMEKTYQQVTTTMPAASIRDPALIGAYEANRQPAVHPFQTYCQRCHTPSQEVGHRAFLPHADEYAVQVGGDIYKLVMRGEMLYASCANRVKGIARGVLIVEEEAVQVEEMRTKVVALGPLQHTLDIEKIKATVEEEEAIGRQVQESLDRKLAGLQWRRSMLAPLWAFLLLFSVVLYAKFKQLKADWVLPWHKK